jgi:hypothetical protein
MSFGHLVINFHDTPCGQTDKDQRIDKQSGQHAAPPDFSLVNTKPAQKAIRVIALVMSENVSPKKKDDSRTGIGTANEPPRIEN